MLDFYWPMYHSWMTQNFILHDSTMFPSWYGLNSSIQSTLKSTFVVKVNFYLKHQEPDTETTKLNSVFTSSDNIQTLSSTIKSYNLIQPYNIAVYAKYFVNQDSGKLQLLEKGLLKPTCKIMLLSHQSLTKFCWMSCFTEISKMHLGPIVTFQI